LGHCAKHLGRTLLMADVCDFLATSHMLNHVDDGGKIVLAHILPREIPEGLVVVVGIKVSVMTTIGVSAGVAEPHIVASASSHKCGSNVSIVDNPGVSGVKNTMLHEHGRLGDVVTAMVIDRAMHLL